MQYFVDKHGEIVGRLYQSGSGYVAEIGRYVGKICSPFFATQSVRCKTYRKAENYLYNNGCVTVAVA